MLKLLQSSWVRGCFGSMILAAALASQGNPAPAAGSTTAEAAPAFLQWADKPPMGWNSWDCFATTVTEAQTRAQADYMAEHLAAHGWQYIVVDIQWYEPQAKGFDYRRDAKLVMDEWGRLWPATNRFPSAINGAGFKGLADYVHGRGLKFGVHLLRGIPRQAVAGNTAVQGTTFHAADIADPSSKCAWNGDMYGVDMTKPGAQEYYDSVFALFASWAVDFVKVDVLECHHVEANGRADGRADDRADYGGCKVLDRLSVVVRRARRHPADPHVGSAQVGEYATHGML